MSADITEPAEKEVLRVAKSTLRPLTITAPGVLGVEYKRNIFTFLTYWMGSVETYPHIFVRLDTDELLAKGPAFNNEPALILCAPGGT